MGLLDWGRKLLRSGLMKLIDLAPGSLFSTGLRGLTAFRGFGPDQDELADVRAKSREIGRAALGAAGIRDTNAGNEIYNDDEFYT